jgi:hypothetical protein
VKDWHRSRRDLLKRLGLGAACLPLLRAHRGWGALAPRKRLMVIEMVNGLRQQYWKPATGALAGQTLPSTSAAFDAVKDAMIFLPDLANPGLGANGRFMFGVMFYGMTPAPGPAPFLEPAGPTLDQIVAKALPAPGGRASLNLGVQLERPPRATTMPGGNFCFWSGAGQPIRPQGDPYQAYRDLFSGPGDLTAVRRLMARRKSILDYVGSNLEEFRSRAGTEDRAFISAHLDSIRDVETRLMAVPQADTCPPPAAPAMLDLAAAASYAPIVDAHLGLMLAALRCGVTNVATLQTSDVVGFSIDFGAFVPGLPAKSATTYKTPYRNWADLAHNPIQGGVDHKRIVDRWFFDRFAATLVQMKAVPEGDGTMLDNTIMLIGNNMQEGANHDGQKVPWMLAGGGKSLNTGNCLASAGHSTASVMAGVCEALGVQHQYGAALPELKKL